MERPPEFSTHLKVEEDLPKSAVLFEQNEDTLAVREQLEKIDDNLLQDVFSSVLGPAGAGSVLSNYIPTKVVEIIHRDQTENGKSMAAAYFDPKIKNDGNPKIIVNALRLKEHADKMGDLFQTTLYAFTHEQVHNLSFDRRKHSDYDDMSDKWFLGFEEKSRVSGQAEFESKHAEHNEAMTDMIAERVAVEYLRRTGERPGQERTDFFELRTEEVYGNYKKKLKDIIVRLAREYDVEQDLILDAMIVAYFKTNKMYDNFPDWLKKNHIELTEEGVFAAMQKGW